VKAIVSQPRWPDEISRKIGPFAPGQCGLSALRTLRRPPDVCGTHDSSDHRQADSALEQNARPVRALVASERHCFERCPPDQSDNLSDQLLHGATLSPHPYPLTAGRICPTLCALGTTLRLASQARHLNDKNPRSSLYSIARRRYYAAPPGSRTPREPQWRWNTGGFLLVSRGGETREGPCDIAVCWHC
jgi:hypothetical protein